MPSEADAQEFAPAIGKAVRAEPAEGRQPAVGASRSLDQQVRRSLTFRSTVLWRGGKSCSVDVPSAPFFDALAVMLR